MMLPLQWSCFKCILILLYWWSTVQKIFGFFISKRWLLCILSGTIYRVSKALLHAKWYFWSAQTISYCHLCARKDRGCRLQCTPVRRSGHGGVLIPTNPLLNTPLTGYYQCVLLLVFTVYVCHWWWFSQWWNLDPVVDRSSRSKIGQVESIKKSSTSRSSRVDFFIDQVDRFADD